MHSSFFGLAPRKTCKTGDSTGNIDSVFQYPFLFPCMLWEESMETNLVNKKRTMYNKGRKYPEEKI